VSAAKVELLFDYASPWSYLANAIAPARLAGAEIVYRPIYLRGLETFAKGLPYCSNKLRYIMRDYARCAEHEGVATTMPAQFPINGLYALRGALAAERLGGFAAYHPRMFAAAWREGRDVSRKEVVCEVARAAGLDEARFAALLDDAAVKEQLRADTAAAEARGVFGAPTFFVGDELFWGHDRLDYVARALRAAGGASSSSGQSSA
jgi:2-hydroxychromene-2-carboxylate isomerase